MERELIIRVDGRGVDEDAASVLVYRLGNSITVVATVENDGDAEVVLDKAAVAALTEALNKLGCRAE